MIKYLKRFLIWLLSSYWTEIVMLSNLNNHKEAKQMVK